jgi:hypothetical protein
MKSLILGLSAGSLVSGSIAAVYWFVASAGLFKPEISKLTVDSPEIDFNWAFLRAIMIAVTKANKLNRWAAIWTGISIVLSAMSTFLSALNSN